MTYSWKNQTPFHRSKFDSNPDLYLWSNQEIPNNWRHNGIHHQVHGILGIICSHEVLDSISTFLSEDYVIHTENELLHRHRHTWGIHWGWKLVKNKNKLRTSWGSDWNNKYHFNTIFKKEQLCITKGCHGFSLSIK